MQPVFAPGTGSARNRSASPVRTGPGEIQAGLALPPDGQREFLLLVVNPKVGEGDGGAPEGIVGGNSCRRGGDAGTICVGEWPETRPGGADGGERAQGVGRPG